MNLDDTIRAMAALGQSKGQVREALGISRNKFTEIVKLLPDVTWQQTDEERAARIAGSKKGNATRHRQHLRTVNGVTGSTAELCERFGPIGRASLWERWWTDVEVWGVAV